MQVFCFPFAGGASYAYRGLVQASKILDVQPLELPGRGRRADETLARDIEVMADDLLQQIIPKVSQFVFFGHSMGAHLAWMVAKRMLDTGRRPPVALFVSGSNAPMISEPRNWHLLPKREFSELLRKMGGCPSEVLDDTELFDYFEPIIRADFEAHAGIQHLETMPIDIPVVALSGSGDPYVHSEGVHRWREITASNFEHHVYPGGHFFLFNQWNAIRHLIESRIIQ